MLAKGIAFIAFRAVRKYMNMFSINIFIHDECFQDRKMELCLCFLFTKQEVLQYDKLWTNATVTRNNQIARNNAFRRRSTSFEILRPEPKYLTVLQVNRFDILEACIPSGIMGPFQNCIRGIIIRTRKTL